MLLSRTLYRGHLVPSRQDWPFTAVLKSTNHRVGDDDMTIANVNQDPGSDLLVEVNILQREVPCDAWVEVKRRAST